MERTGYPYPSTAWSGGGGRLYKLRGINVITQTTHLQKVTLIPWSQQPPPADEAVLK